MFCKECGNQIPDAAVICMKCGVPTGIAPVPGTRSDKSRTVYALLGLFIGPLGIHNFYAGFKGKAVAQLLITLLTGWLIFPLAAVWVWNIVEVCTVTKDAKGLPFS